MNWKRSLSVLILAVTVVGCNLPAPTHIPSAAAPTLEIPTLVITVIPPQQPTAAVTQPPAGPSATSAPLPSQASAAKATLTSGSFTSFKATTSANGVKLRTGPGTLYPAATLVAEGTALNVYGRSRGNEWVYVNTPDGLHGWVFAQLVQLEKDLGTAPEVEPGDAQIVRGHVADKSGAPVNGIQFAFEQGSGTNAPRTDAMTDANGDFYAFFPSAASGTWTVSYVAIAATSRMSSAPGTIHPDTLHITLPQTATLAFTWE
ncbi:MAG TPA: SH3 domain-containing protein [Anaerolineaceae bacterium]|jgi:SH3-like domain-containing protein